MKINLYHPTEEKINVLSHFIGLMLSLVALIMLVIKSSFTGDAWYIVSFSIYGLSLIILYLASTLYHYEKKPNKRAKLNIFDHAAIYVLIAGSYTPYTLITLNGTIGWVLFGVSWGIAIIGIVFKLFFTGRFDRISTAMYVLIGWMVVFAIKPLYENLSSEGLFWLFLGGVFYTVGAVFYSLNKLKFNHAIFHFFVLFGSASHFVSIFFFV